MKNHISNSNNNKIDPIQFIGIDFGTYKSTMFKFDTLKGEAKVIRNMEGEEATLSLAFYKAGEEVLIGTPVLDMLEHPDLCKNVIAEVKIHLADPITYPVPSMPKPVEVAEEILRKLKRDAETSGEFDGEITHAVITYPVAFTQSEQDMLLQAAHNAGFHEVHVLKEPEAAALAFAKEGNQPGNCILVYDLGAGTFDLAILVRDKQTGSYQATGLFDGLRSGGNNFDRALYDYCDALFMEQHGRSMSIEEGTELRYLRDCRRRKENLSTQRQVSFSWIVSDPDNEKKTIPFKFSLDRAKFEALIQKMVGETIKHTQTLLKRAQTSDHNVDTIVLIGGSSHIPLVRNLLQTTLPIEPQTWDNRHRAVALGAAYYANELWGAGYQPRQYQQAIKEAQHKGRWNEETKTHFASLRKTLGLADNQAEQLEREILGFTIDETIQDLERRVNEQELQAVLDVFKKYAQEASAARGPFTFLLVGRSGVGKSSSINSLLDREVAPVGHHEPTTMTVEFYPHEVSGIKFTVIDTPGLCDDLEEKGNDERYLELIRTQVPKVDCLWYLTNLSEHRFYPDEKRAIRLISEGCGKDIWKHAIIVCTHANAVNYDNSPRIKQFENAYSKRTAILRKEIALWSGTAIANAVPSVAIDNSARTTLDGKEWLGKLYIAISSRLSGEAFTILTGGIADRVKVRSQPSKITHQLPETTHQLPEITHYDNDNSSRYTGKGTSPIIVDDLETLGELLGHALDYIGEKVANAVTAFSNTVTNAYNSAKSWFTKLFK